MKGKILNKKRTNRNKVGTLECYALWIQIILKIRYKWKRDGKSFLKCKLNTI